MLDLYGTGVESRLLLGTALYPSPAIMADAIRAARCDIVTVSLRRESGTARAGQDFWGFIICFAICFVIIGLIVLVAQIGAGGTES